MNNFFDYDGWELKFFDNANNFRNYQFNLIKKHINGSVCEIGPGNGSLSAKYIDLCDELILYEPSENLNQSLNKMFEDNKKIKIFKETFPTQDNKFNCVLLMDVLEHIEKPNELLEKIFFSLKHNGKIIINVPAFQHLYSNFDKDVGHFRRYNKKTFYKELKNINCSNCNMFYYDSLGYLLSLISKFFFNEKNYKNNFDKKISMWNSLIPLSSILDHLFFFKFGKSLFIIITK